nr:MAG TPA: hypothetical protein [Caudoviricetes sp.]
MLVYKNLNTLYLKYFLVYYLLVIIFLYYSYFYQYTILL